MFDAVSFPGGGNRCYWQGGFWETAAPALGLNPRLVVGVSGGAFAAAYCLLGVGERVRERVVEGCRRGLPDVDWRALATGRQAFPVAALYRELLGEIFDADAFDRIRTIADLRIMVARPPKGWPGWLASSAGLAAYQIEKKLFTPVHRRWGGKLGFSAAYIAVRDLPDARSWADVTYASACVPPIIPLQLVQGKPALDGGMVDNAPVAPLLGIEKAGGRTLVLLTRRYPKIPAIPNRLYVQPSETIDVGQFTITKPDAILAAHELGRRDGEAFARGMCA